jgi:hypothetical protein
MGAPSGKSFLKIQYAICYHGNRSGRSPRKEEIPMSKLYVLVTALALAALLFGLVSCSLDGAVSNPAADGDTSLNGLDKSASDPDPDPDVQSLLAWLYNLDNYPDDSPSYIYEDALRGVVSIAEGGTISGRPASWPSNFLFKYTVYPNSIDLSTVPENATHVEIIIKVPVASTVFPEDDQVMPLKFYPDGLNYLGTPATASICFHPNIETDCEFGFKFYSADKNVAGLFYSQESYSTAVTAAVELLDKGLYNPINPIEEELIIDCRTWHGFTVRHHSKWAMEEDTGGGPNVP